MNNEWTNIYQKLILWFRWSFPYYFLVSLSKNAKNDRIYGTLLTWELYAIKYIHLEIEVNSGMTEYFSKHFFLIKITSAGETKTLKSLNKFIVILFC